MKRLALLLAAMGIVSVGAMAEAPKLEVVSIGQNIEIENENGAQTFDNVWLYNDVALKYGDWSFGLQAGKNWSVDFDGASTHSKDSRLQLDAWKKIDGNLKLGARYRGSKNYDRYYARWAYANEMFWSAGDIWYEATNGKTGGEPDWVKAEVFPLGLSYGDFKLGYYMQYYFVLGDKQESEEEYEYEHQLRAYWDFYKTEKLTLSTEARLALFADNEYKGKEPKYRHIDDFGRFRLYLKSNYKVTESLEVYASYAYGWRNYKYENGDSRDNYGKYVASKQSAENYQDIILGWKYTF